MQTNLGLRQQQSLALTPALRQSLRLLQLPLHELEQTLADALQENPLLLGADEPAPESAGDAPAQDDSSAEYDSVFDQTGNEAFTASQPHDDGRFLLPEAAATASFSDVLLAQLRECRLNQREALLVACLIAELDDQGYLATPLEVLVQAEWPVAAPSCEELASALACLQSFDPPGVGARSLSECLLLQLRDDALGDAFVPAEVLAAARTLASDGLTMLAKGRWGRLRAILGCDDRTLSAARALLCRLEPRPARPWAETAGVVVPELLVRRVAGVWQVRLNEAVLPRVRLYDTYGAIAASAAGSVALRAQWQQAKGLVAGLQQRYQTLLRVAEAVVQHQQAYFDRGDAALLPLRQADIAQVLSLHESTVSRAVAHKYLQGPGGVVPLSHCFGATLALSDNDDAGGVSSQAVRHRVTALIAAEDPRQPLSDSRLAALLCAEGVQVARRTVAKYREVAGLPPASRRGGLAP